MEDLFWILAERDFAAAILLAIGLAFMISVVILVVLSAIKEKRGRQAKGENLACFALLSIVSILANIAFTRIDADWLKLPRVMLIVLSAFSAICFVDCLWLSKKTSTKDSTA